MDRDWVPYTGFKPDAHDHSRFKQHLPGSVMADRVPGVSAVDAFASRQRISDFLLRHSTAYDLLPESGKVVSFDVSLPVRQAFHALYEQGVPTAPLWDSERQEFVGMLTASDFIVILQQLGINGAVLVEEEELDTHTIAAWKEEKLSLVRQVNGSTPVRRPLLFVDPDQSLRQVADILLQNEVATVPVLHFNGAVPELLHLACLSGVLKCICRHFRSSASSLPLLSESIGSLQRFGRLGTWIPELSEGTSKPVAMLQANAPLIMAFALLLQGQVSGLPVVDEFGSLLDVYSRSDITALAKDQAYADRPLDEITVFEALRTRMNVQGSGTSAAVRCQTCLRSESLRSVIERLALPGVRRVICIEECSRRVEGIISLRDVFQFLLLA